MFFLLESDGTLLPCYIPCAPSILSSSRQPKEVRKYLFFFILFLFIYFTFILRGWKVKFKGGVKTQFLCKILDKRLKRGCPSITLLFTRYASHFPQVKIKSMLHITYKWNFLAMAIWHLFFFIKGWAFGMAVEMKRQTYINYHPLWCGNSSNKLRLKIGSAEILSPG